MHKYIIILISLLANTAHGAAAGRWFLTEGKYANCFKQEADALQKINATLAENNHNQVVYTFDTTHVVIPQKKTKFPGNVKSLQFSQTFIDPFSSEDGSKTAQLCGYYKLIANMSNGGFIAWTLPSGTYRESNFPLSPKGSLELDVNSMKNAMPNTAPEICNGLYCATVVDYIPPTDPKWTINANNCIRVVTLPQIAKSAIHQGPAASTLGAAAAVQATAAASKKVASD